MDTNCYVIWDTESKEAAIIDPGGDPGRILSVVETLGISPTWILLTHGHFDHTFHVGDILGHYDVIVAMHEADIAIMADMMDIAAMFYDVSHYVSFTLTDFLTDGQEIALGTSAVKVVHTPGHSQGGVCLATDAGVFCGDTIFAGSIGRTDFQGGSYEQLINSIRDRVLTLDDATLLFPGHGPATSVGQERRTNPYLG